MVLHGHRRVGNSTKTVRNFYERGRVVAMTAIRHGNIGSFMLDSSNFDMYLL